MTVQGAPTQDLDLADVIDGVADYSKYSLNCHQVGIIKSYDSAAQTCEVSLGVKRKLATGKIEDYPLLLDVPVIILSGGGASLTFPISEGDKCLILFNDRDLDIFLEEDTIAVPNTQRAHDYSDGIALVGLRTVSERAQTNEEAAQLHTGDKKVAILNDNQSLQDLIARQFDQIDSLITTISNLVTVGSAASQTLDPGTKVNLANEQAAFAALQAEYDQLLHVGV